MNDNQSDTEFMARAIVKAIDRTLKRRSMEPLKVCAALGAAAAFVTAAALPEFDETLDAIAIGALGSGYVTVLPTIRKAKAN